MKFRQRLGSMAVIGLFAACSGQYRVGSDAASAGAPNEGGSPSSFAGAPSGATDSGVGGSYALAGASSSSTVQTFCGTQWTTASSVQFAPPDVVSQRLGKFLFGISTLGPPTLPPETTRQWAGTLATSTLTSSGMAGILGLHRFVSEWWPGTPETIAWAMYFISEQATLSDLLTTDALLPHGAGMLTDLAVLRSGGISERGNFVLGHLLCMNVPPEPDSVSEPPLKTGQTRRSQIEAATASQPCRVCHALVDPIGYALGNFALDGSYQTRENDLPIDTQAALTMLPNSGNQTVLDAVGLGSTLSNSCEAALCLTRQLLQYAVDSAALPAPGSAQEVAAIAAQFTAGGLRLLDLVRLVVESDVFLRGD
jgi:hypothetical protein